MRSKELIAALHASTGIPVGEIELKVRRLRENKLFTRETRSPNSPRPTVEDIANLLLMILSEAPALYAKETIERGWDMEIDRYSIVEEGGRELPGRLDIVRKSHSFLDGLQMLLQEAIDNPHWFSEDSAFAGYRDTSVSFDRQEFTGTIIFEFDEGYGGPASETLLILNCDYGGRSASVASSRFRQINLIEATLFGDIAAAWHREEGE